LHVSYRKQSVGIAAFAPVALAALALALLTGCGGSDPPATIPPIASGRQIDALLAGIPQRHDTLGSPRAPVTLQFFGDLECPNSKEFALEALPTLVQRWVRPGKLRIEYRSLETSTREPPTFMLQQAAALAAGMQDKLWNYVERFYYEQGVEHTDYVDESYLDKLAEQTPGLQLERWSKERGYPPLAAEVAADEQTATGMGMHITPAFLIGRTGGRMEKLTRFIPSEPAGFDTAIERVLSRPASHPRSVAAAGGDA
jgi:protein-disulfide isomerase